jgi:hypothetical protein
MPSQAQNSKPLVEGKYRQSLIGQIRLSSTQIFMAKSKLAKAKRKRNVQADLPQKLPKTASTLTPPPDGANIEPKHLSTVISEEELDITVETLTTLAQYPSLTKSKACKDLRVAVYDFRQVCTTGINTAGMLLVRCCVTSNGGSQLIVP